MRIPVCILRKDWREWIPLVEKNGIWPILDTGWAVEFNEKTGEVTVQIRYLSEYFAYPYDRVIPAADPRPYHRWLPRYSLREWERMLEEKEKETEAEGRVSDYALVLENQTEAGRAGEADECGENPVRTRRLSAAVEG